MTDDKSRPPDQFPLRFLCEVGAFPVVLWSTRLGTWGCRYAGLHALLGAGVWPVLFAGVYGPHPRIGGVLLFWYASLGWLAAHRAAGLVRRFRGDQCHSYFVGVGLFDRGDDPADRLRDRFRTTAAAAAVGFLCFLGPCRPLGALILLSAVAKAAADLARHLAVADRLRQMADAHLETEYYVELFRRRHDR